MLACNIGAASSSNCIVSVCIMFYISFIDDNWQNSGPLFFYTGNEGAIEGFMENSGFIFTLAKQFNALVVFAEHVSIVLYSYL